MPPVIRLTRRDLVKAGASAAALAVLPRPLLAQLGARPEPAPPIQDPRIKALALRAIDAARTAGASYADVRLTHTSTREFRYARLDGVVDMEAMVVGARALVDGYWGYASGPVWSADEMVRLGREAVHQAKANTLGQSRPVELAPRPVVRDGHWVMPVEIDPFATSPFEIADYLASLGWFVKHFPHFEPRGISCVFEVQEKAFAASDGSYCTQRLHRSTGSLAITFRKRGLPELTYAVDRLTPAGLGWELYTGQPLREYIRQVMAELEEDAKLPLKPIEVGRYDTACDPWTMGRIMDQTLGRATELDRALGYEANAGGTSYLNKPLEMVGTFQAGAPAITVTAERSAHGGAATTKWDDEGVVPDEFTLVRDGVLADFQTTRESAGWLADYYADAGVPVHSHGCAVAPSALEAPLTHAPNLTLAAGGEALDFDAAVKAVGKGIAVREGGVDMDFQSVTGLGLGRIYEVKDGKRVARLAGAGFLFRATELWKSVKALGGAESVRRYGVSATKGEPAQRTYHSVAAPPAILEQLTFVDIMRKA